MSSLTSKEDWDARRKLFVRSLNCKTFCNPFGPWVIVPDGSFMGYFDWVPMRLRVGSWSVFPPLCLASAAWYLFINNPMTQVPLEQKSNTGYHYPEAYSIMWYYNIFGFVWMCFVLKRVCASSIFVVITFTVLSWTTMTLRHGCSALAPFLFPQNNKFHSAILQFHEISRFLVLVSATITFTVWNFVLAPLIYYKFMDSTEKKKRFLKWNSSFELCQVHAFNLPIAILNTVVSVDRSLLFSYHDLWFSLMWMTGYGIFYITILDRFGVHLYPIFSPRSHLAAISTCLTFGLIVAIRSCWNFALASGFLR